MIKHNKHNVSKHRVIKNNKRLIDRHRFSESEKMVTM